MKRKIALILVSLFASCLSGCGKADILNQYDMDGIAYIAYTDIDTVCESQELSKSGADLLSSMEEYLLLSYVMDSNIELTEELGEYDHLILTNPLWIERFGETDKLKSIELDSLSESMQDFLSEQLSLLTTNGSALSDEIGLYQYDGGELLAFPVNVTLSGADPIKAENPLIILVNNPSQTLQADSCMLPLTSSGNILFTNREQLQAKFEDSQLDDYASVETWNNDIK